MSETPAPGPTGEIPGGEGDNALEFRDPEKARKIAATLEEFGEQLPDPPATIMHVCGSHEQSIAKFGLRSMLPDTVRLIMGPGCPVCITNMPEVDDAVALAEQGVTIATYGDMLKVPGTTKSLDDARAEGADVRVVYSAADVVDIAEDEDGEVVFFATGFETTAAPTAAVVLDDPPENLSVLSAHKYVPPAMEIVAEMPDTDIQGYLAAGNAAIITGSGVFEDLVDEHDLPVVVGGFEPLDILAGIAKLVQMIGDDVAAVENAYPRCVTEAGNEHAQEQLWEVFETVSGEWRGIAEIPDANLVLRSEYAEWDATERFDVDTTHLRDEAASRLADDCICGDIMSGKAKPTDCGMFGEECTPDDPVGACMVSSEGTCKIWHEYGGRPDL
jgi:hydrogenase expression/formation protein HypD